MSEIRYIKVKIRTCNGGVRCSRGCDGYWEMEDGSYRCKFFNKKLKDTPSRYIIKIIGNPDYRPSRETGVRCITCVENEVGL